MEKFQTITSSVVPVPIRDVDTDMIIPAQFMTSISMEGYGENLFRRLRDTDKEFPLNQDRYRASKIMVADDNFGCGSSREHAVWALTSWGFKVIIAKSFADIFAGNSAKNGLLLITLPAETVGRFQEEARQGLTLTVDLNSQSISLPDGSVVRFDYDPFRKHCLLEGLEDLDYIMNQGPTIEAFRRSQKCYVSTAELSK